MDLEPPYEGEGATSITPQGQYTAPRPSDPDPFLKVTELFDRLPHLAQLLAQVDSRVLFSRGLRFMMKLAALFILLFGSLILVAGAMESWIGTQASTIGKQLMAGFVVLAFLIPLTLSSIILYRRFDRLRFKANATTVELMKQTLATSVRVSVEILAVVALFTLVFQGFVNFIMGDNGAFTFALYNTTEAFASLVFGNSSSDTAWLLNRMFGLVLILSSAFVSFSILVSGYLGIDLIRMAWEWVVLVAGFLKRVLSNTFLRSSGSAS